MANFIPAVEVIYRELARPKTPETKPAVAATTKPALTRDDVVAFLSRQRVATPSELAHIVGNAKEYRLTDSERNQLSVDLTIFMAHERQNHGRREHPSDRFVAHVLGLLDTPYGMIERSFIDDLLRTGAENIQRCKRHEPPLCACWASQRAILWQASARGEKSSGRLGGYKDIFRARGT